jgi:hypothetical protein
MSKGRHGTAVLAFATVLGFAAPMTLYAAGTRYLDPALTPADAMPAYEIVTRVREMALEPASRPVRRGSYYVLHAYDRRGVEMRVVADAQLGDILSVAPVRPVAYAPLRGGPRIIHVPGPEDEQATAEPSDDPDAGPPDDVEEVAPKPRVHKLAPVRRRPFSAPKPAEHRAVLTAPPQASADTLAPIYPTPKFSREDKAEKFTAPPPASAPVARDEAPSQ